MIDYTKPIDFALAGLKQVPLKKMFVILGIPLLLFFGMTITAINHGWTQPGEVPFAIAAATLLCLVPAALLRWICRVRVTVERGHLIVRTSVGRKRIPLENLRDYGVRIVNLKKHPELRPRLRSWAASIPGLNSGWFHLNNREKAICIVLDQRHVTYLRSDADNLSVLLSLRNPELLCALIARTA